MPPAALLTLRLLILAEPAVTAIAALLWFRPAARRRLPPMRGYLLARLPVTSVSIALLYSRRFVALSTTTWIWIYLCAYWASFFLILLFLLRVAASAVQRILDDLPGLQALGQLFFRWLIFTTAFLVLPTAVALIRVFHTREVVSPALFRFITAVSLAQLLPLVLAFAVGIRVRTRPTGWILAILAGLGLEPGFDLATSWHRAAGVMIWSNLLHEQATYAALALWIACAFLPDFGRTRPPSMTVLYWDRIARRVFHPRPGGRGPRPQGGQPWPTRREP